MKPLPLFPSRFLLVRRAISAFAGAAILCSPTVAQVPTPELLTVFPPGGQPGTTVEVTLTGAHQEDAAQLIFSHPGIAGQAKPAADEAPKTPRPATGNFDVKIAGEVPTGIYEARVVGRWGASNPRAFVVGHLAEIIKNGANRSRAAAQPIRVGVSVNGRTDAAARDYYQLKLKQQQRILVECFAERIDSRLDGTLIVLDAAGHELAFNRDTIGRDPFLDFTAPADGEYTIGVFDFLYRGGAEHFYRLNVHDGPSIDYVFPPCGLPGATRVLAVFGRNLPEGRPAGVTLGGVPLQTCGANVPLPGDEASRGQLGFGDRVAPPAALLDSFEYRLGNGNPIRVDFAQAPVILETEPNDEPARAQPVSVPCEVAGQFYPARDVDGFRFDAQGGAVYWIDVISHRLGLDTDPCLLVQKVTKDPAGKEQVTEVASVDDPANRAARIGGDFDTSSDDPSYRLVVAEDATYRVTVRDQFGGTRSDPRCMYRLVIRPEQPDFRLVAVPAPVRPGAPNPQQAVTGGSLVLQRGGSTVLDVRAERRDGFAGEIELSVEGLPPGVTCAGALLGGSVPSATLVFTADENAAFAVGSIRVLGKAYLGGREVIRFARGGTCVWGTANRQQEPPVFRATRDLRLSVTDKFTAPVSVRVGDGNVVETSLGATFDVPVKAIRRGDFQGDMVLTAIGAPAEIKPADVTIKGGATDGRIAFAITKPNTSPGSYTFCWKTDVKHKVTGSNNAPQELTTAWASTPIKLRLFRSPLAISTAPGTVEVKRGDKATVSLTLTKRFGFDDVTDITLELPSGVAGLTAAKLSLAKGSADGKLELTVAPTAPAGRHTVTIRARAKFNNVAVEAARPLTVNVSP
jgi:hypothetical protein